MKKTVTIGGKELIIGNLDKKFWPEGLTKADLIKYYVDIAPVILPYIRNRPLTMVRYPDGMEGDFFYQKECPDYAPEWVETFPVPSSGRRVINFVTAAEAPTLAWMASQGCIEVHGMLSRTEALNYPDIAVVDLDPMEPATFRDTVEMALVVKGVLDEFGLTAFPKTSGATGIHLYLPLETKHTYEEVKNAMGYIAHLIARHYPQKATVERKVENRTGRVYIDYLQNGYNRSMAWVYSLRPHPGAPVSTPLEWWELEQGLEDPRQFNIHTIWQRLAVKGDIFRGLLQKRQSLQPIIDLL
ncbi:MAG: non-homologous end-joining DNA ligase [Clostridia bacterium]|nr:non-homologous end-joining DNA ligase [Clostridia bacterium]